MVVLPRHRLGGGEGGGGARGTGWYSVRTDMVNVVLYTLVSCSYAILQVYYTSFFLLEWSKLKKGSCNVHDHSILAHTK